MDEAQKKYVLSKLIDEILKEPAKYGLRGDGSLRVGDKLNFRNLFEQRQKLELIFKKAEQLTLEQKKEILVRLSPKPVVKPDFKKSEIKETKNFYEITSAPNPVSLNKPLPVSKSLSQDVDMVQVEGALREEINNIYGSTGFFKKVYGVDSEEWKLMRNLNANKALDYYTGDSTNAGLTSEVITELAKSEKHKKLIDQVLGLMQKTNGTLKPYENDTVEQFLRRLGAFVMRISNG